MEGAHRDSNFFIAKDSSYMYVRTVEKMLFVSLSALINSQHLIERSLQVSYSSSRYIVISQYSFKKWYYMYCTRNTVVLYIHQYRPPLAETTIATC